MALFDSLAAAGAGIVTDQTKVERKFTIWIGLAQQPWVETTTTETREWQALTYAAAAAAVTDGAQPESGTYTWSMYEDTRVVGSYVVRRMQESKSYERDT